MNVYPILLLSITLLLTTGPVQAQSTGAADVVMGDLSGFNRSGDFALIKDQVIEPQLFYGLASYYNSVTFYRVSEGGVTELERNQRISLAAGERFAAVGRFHVLIIETSSIDIDLGEETFTVVKDVSTLLQSSVVRKDKLHNVGAQYDQLRYHHLWFPFAQLSRLIEWSLVNMRSSWGFGWGITIVLFTVLLKILMAPLGIISARMQSEVSRIHSQLAPTLADIKSRYDGEEAHKRIMAAHKDLGVSTFFALKPMLIMFVQLPIWVAVFNALGEMPQLDGWGFLWIDNLAYPDSIAALPTVLPLLGDSVSLLPLLMTAVTIVSALLFQDRHAPPEELQRQKRNLYLMALSFLVLFYPFPAAMVGYWTLSNALQIVQQRVIRV